MTFAVNRKFMEALLRSPEWNAKLERAKTDEEVTKVLVDFAREKDFKVKYISKTREKKNEELGLG